MSKVVLKENDNLALIYPGAQLLSYNLFFFKIMRRKTLFRPYDSELSEIAAGGTLDFANWDATAPGGDGISIFDCYKERPFRIIHFAAGIAPSEMCWYTEQPAGTVQTGWSHETPPKITSKLDYIPGWLSPLNNPTIATETIMHYNISVHPGLRNDSDRTIRPSVLFLGAGYDTIQVMDPTLIDKMLGGKPPCRFVTIGGLRDFTYTVPDEWKKPTVVDQAKIAEILGGVYR